ncbi:hypothetical protein Ahy_A10g047849 [Arachis hypogaea]|uniref:Protein FAR1-RELATED SEQUENCE n=1 Tax=Arachis hypogaea TaxID=3818 RepID=A0A445B3Q6_ARAHY|nr:hypothetical protein Ahy_A10g047849 [Arachis hypogaea]
MDDSTSNSQLNQSEVDFEIESNEVPEFVSKVGMTFKTLDDAAKFYKNYSKIAVWNSHSKDSFDRNWNDFLLKYGLVENKWLSESEELTVILHRAYDNVMVEMEELKAKRKGTCSLSHKDANLKSINELQSPLRVRTRGRPKNRLGSKLDKQIANALKKKKTKALNEVKVMFFKYVVIEFNFLVNRFANM